MVVQLIEIRGVVCDSIMRSSVFGDGARQWASWRHWATPSIGPTWIGRHLATGTPDKTPATDRDLSGPGRHRRSHRVATLLYRTTASARSALVARLRTEHMAKSGRWTREELYEGGL